MEKKVDGKRFSPAPPTQPDHRYIGRKIQIREDKPIPTWWKIAKVLQTERRMSNKPEGMKYFIKWLDDLIFRILFHTVWMCYFSQTWPTAPCVSSISNWEQRRKWMKGPNNLNLCLSSLLWHPKSSHPKTSYWPQKLGPVLKKRSAKQGRKGWKL